MSMLFTDFLRRFHPKKTEVRRNFVSKDQLFFRSEALITKVMLLPDAKVGL